MKRKLIDFEVFKKIRDESLSAAEAELTEAEDVLSKALGVDGVSLHCFGETDVTYKTLGNSYVHAGYRITNNSVIFENIEELVIDETTSKNESHKVLTTLVEELLGNNDAKAGALFMQYMTMPSVRRGLTEGVIPDEDKKDKKEKKGKKNPFKKKNWKDKWDEKFESRKKGKDANWQVKASKKTLKEWYRLAENVASFLDYKELGPTIRSSEVRRDDKGNVVALRVPTAHVRNEAKILNLTYKNMLDTEVKVLRGKMKNVQEETAFCRAMSDLRKTNALSDENAMQEVLEAVVRRWPEIIYLTQAELSQKIGTALESVGESNYDDEMCDFLAEAVLRTAVSAFSERVTRIARLTGGSLDKKEVYESFQAIVGKFYPTLDEHLKLEMQVFVDLYNALVEVHNIARNESNEALRSEANSYLKELHGVLSQEREPDHELAGEVASWLASLVETNLSGGDWDVSNSTHQTWVGDHPQMAKNAQKGYTPSSDFSGEWGDSAPVSDGKSYKGKLADEMRNNAWGNWSSDDTWPSLNNPYIPKPFGDYTMKGEKGADKDGNDDWSRYQSGDTWPNLKNPNVPASPWEPEKYKMKSDNLVVDK
jgi:hypothetical protein